MWQSLFEAGSYSNQYIKDCVKTESMPPYLCYIFFPHFNPLSLLLFLSLIPWLSEGGHNISLNPVEL